MQALESFCTAPSSSESFAMAVLCFQDILQVDTAIPCQDFHSPILFDSMLLYMGIVSAG